MLRKHQAEMVSVVNRIISGSRIKVIQLNATPGSGKSLIPVLAGQLITAGLADALCWIVPRKNLQDQGEVNFVDPYFRDMLNHKLTIRSSTNEINPCRGLDGFATTYQALGVDDEKSVLNEFKQKRFILILDEFHHVEKDGIWHEALKPIFEKALFVVLMTGTLERGDGKEIAFIKYKDIGSGTLTPCIDNTESMAVIEYNRTDALAEKAIIPLKFFLSDGKASWIDKKGHTVEIESLSKARETKAAQAVFTVLHSEYASQMLVKCTNHWMEHKKENPRSKMLVVTADYEMATEISEKLQGYGFNASIATSHETLFANRSIRLFKEGSIDILVTIAMAYEGLDCPEITHICCLTNIRSIPWIEQMVARAVRVDRQAGPYETQTAFVFAPDDIMFRKIVKAIQKEQLPFVEPVQPALFKEDEEETIKEDVEELFIAPLSSSITGNREMHLGCQTLNQLPKTPKVNETELRKRINDHVKLYCYKNRYDYQDINAQIKKEFFKPRAEMTIPDLEKVLVFIGITYPLDSIRGTGIQRVSTKVMPWMG